MADENNLDDSPEAFVLKVLKLVELVEKDVDPVRKDGTLSIKDKMVRVLEKHGFSTGFIDKK